MTIDYGLKTASSNNLHNIIRKINKTVIYIIFNINGENNGHGNTENQRLSVKKCVFELPPENISNIFTRDMNNPKKNKFLTNMSDNHR